MLVPCLPRHDPAWLLTALASALRALLAATGAKSAGGCRCPQCPYLPTCDPVPEYRLAILSWHGRIFRLAAHSSVLGMIRFTYIKES